MNPRLDMDRLIDDRRTRIIVCCGSGGVGKTTAAAAIGLRAAERGRQVCVLTVDPARRLAQSMGLSSLDNTPRLIEGVDQSADGSLHAMMLDMKRTFDEIVEAHSDPARAAQILANRSTSRCRPASPAPRSTWRWRSSASCGARTNGT